MNCTIAIFTSREKIQMLARTIDAAKRAAPGARIDVLVNGNPALAIDVLKMDASVEVTCILRGDKAHAWNTYVHDIWPGAALTFFIDGYARVRPDALDLIAAGMKAEPLAIAGTGVPTVGRSAASQRAAMRGGGIHGNLYAIDGATMRSFRECGFRLPLGIYRTDPTVASVLFFGLNPRANQWDYRRVHVAENATWDREPGSLLSWRDMKAQWNRMLRQAQGALENAAVKQILVHDKKLPGDMPRTARALVLGWAEAHPAQVRKVYRRAPLAWWALRRMASAPDETVAEQRGALPLAIRP